MTSPRLLQITRELNRKKPAAEKAPASGSLGETLEAMIQQQVEARVSQELGKQREPTGLRLRQIFNAPPARTDFAQVPEPPKAVPPKDLTALIHRDGEGRAAWIELGGLKLEVMRNELGRITGMRQRDESPVLPAPPIPELARARQYQEPEPR